MARSKPADGDPGPLRRVDRCMLDLADPLSRLAASGYTLMVNPRRMAEWMAGQGAAAPAAFIALQVVQVVLAPIPGEATGFAGGLLFGTEPGFLYSTIGLTLGSWINLLLGRLLGCGFVRRVVAEAHLSRFDTLMQGQGLLGPWPCLSCRDSPRITSASFAA